MTIRVEKGSKTEVIRSKITPSAEARKCSLISGLLGRSALYTHFGPISEPPISDINDIGDSVAGTAAPFPVADIFGKLTKCFQCLVNFCGMRSVRRRVSQRGMKGGTMFAGINNLSFTHFVKGFDHLFLFDKVNERKELLLVNSLPSDIQSNAAGTLLIILKRVSDKRCNG